jgi:hypothetical protein
MTFKTAAKSVGSGLLTGLEVLATASARNRIYEIDREMEPLQERLAELQEERDHLESVYL